MNPWAMTSVNLWAFGSSVAVVRADPAAAGYPLFLLLAIALLAILMGWQEPPQSLEEGTC